MANFGPTVALIFAICFVGDTNSAQYLGKYLGKLSELHHGVSGEVYAVDSRTLHIKDFTYDGQGPAAYFYASTLKSADRAGFRLRDEKGSGDVIRRYRKEGVTLTLPEGKTLNNIKIFYVWCEEFEVNFGDVKIPRNFDYPRPQKIDALKGVHAISSDNIVIVDAQTLLIPNLSYDGEAPDAKFWVGRGPKPSPDGIRVPDENGKEIPLRRYDRKTVVLTLPSDLTVFDIGHFGIWCEAFTVDFGHVQIPQQLNIPPSLRMLGVSPQSKLNCEVLYDDLAFEVRWAVAGESIVLQLVAKLDNGEYMSFGISGDRAQSVMIGGDVVVAWVDKATLKGFAEDYYLDAKSQCSGPSGSCPDNRLSEHTNNIRLLNAAMVNGYSIVTYQRPLKASDEFDKPIYTNQSQAIIWAIGPLNQRNEVSFHSQYTKRDKLIDFGRPAKWNCPMPEGEQPAMKPVPIESRQKIVQEDEVPSPPPPPPSSTAIPSRGRNTERRRGSNRGNVRADAIVSDSEKSTTRTRQPEQRRGSTRGNSRTRTVPTPAPVKSRNNAWSIPPIQCYEPEDGVFYAQMGPTGGKRGYPAITGHVGWGISWYINGLLIPEINLVRGKTYRFVVEGGFDPEIPAKYHPFYITDDPVGGYEYKTPEEKKAVQIFAGARKDSNGNLVPTGTGRLCHWTQQGDSDADDFDSFGAYQRTLELKCDQGEPGVIQWTPDANTPNTVYYQCFTHRYLGWKINILDSCDQQSAGSEIKPVIVEAPKTIKDDLDLEESPSIRVETRVKPNIINEVNKEDNNKASTVSERKSNPPKIDPNQFDGQPILIQQVPQQSYFNPYYGPFYAHTFENPYHQHTFRPSTPLNTFKEDDLVPVTVNLETTTPSSTTTSTSTTIVTPSSTSTTTTTAATTTTSATTTTTTTTTETPTTTTTSTTSTSTTTSAPKVPGQLIGSASLNKKISLPPPPNFQTPFRRPQYSNRQPPMYFQMKAPMRQPPPPLRQYQITYKKPIYRPMKMQTRPHIQFDKNVMFPPLPPKPSPNVIYTSPNQIYNNKQIVTKPTEIVKTNEIKNVEISPQQASTEREPEIQTAAPSFIVPITPAPQPHYEPTRFQLRPAYNTGFKPETVVIESGFKPIISREFQDRMAEDEPELEYESEIGVINTAGEKIQSFEPIFVPSPTDKPVKIRKRPYNIKKSTIKFVLKEPRSLKMSDLEEPVAEAAERVESYYLPPQGQIAASQPPQKPSDIDVEDLNLDSPPDVVVTYDGKKVSGASLTARFANDRSSILDMRASKAAEFIKARPQFVPYKGELPPLNPDFFKNAPQLQSRGVISRDLGIPSVESTKLVRVRRSIDVHSRSKRFAHHTAEHTAEQERQRNNNGTQTNSSNYLFISIYTQCSFIAVALIVSKYL